MPRPLRLHMPGCFYHVTLRGNHRQPIFFCESDRGLLDRIVAEALVRVSARLHAYCWMTNHLHLLIQISDAPLGKLVLRVASKYARMVQLGLQTTGHLFERRYHAVLVDADAYLLTLIRYIHLNPVRGALVREPAAYKWSSHLNYLGVRTQPWVTTEFGLRLLAADPALSRRKYLEFIGASADDCWGSGELQTHPDNNQILGDDTFAARIASSRLLPRSQRSLEDLLQECGRLFDVTPEALASANRNRQLSAARAWISQQAVDQRIASVTAVARRLGRTETAIRRLMERHAGNSA